jgi:hypothetical protein
MVHFSCDLCGKDLTASGDSRYVVKISAYPGSDPNQITEEDLDEEHLEHLAECLEREESRGSDGSDRDFQGFRFDLCPACHRKFVKDPLGKELVRSLDLSDFSQN